MDNIRILALSGSLRKKSYNTALIKATAKLSPAGVEVLVYSGLGLFPLFNPDRENETILPVKKLQQELQRSDGLIIASPEYAHGISGVLKNALDWLVSGAEFPNMPVALFNTSPRATHAQAALRDVITTMSGNIIEEATMTVPLLGTDLDVHGIINNNDMSQYIVEKMAVFRDSIITNKAE